MPYKIEKIGGKYYVVEQKTGKKKNKKGYVSKEAALPYMRALYFYHNKGKNK